MGLREFYVKFQNLLLLVFPIPASVQSGLGLRAANFR
jgi:hypothetical protein